MFGTHFYHSRIKKSVAVFGSLFNDLYVVKGAGGSQSHGQMKVPLTYAPKRKFIERIRQMQKGEAEERQVAIQLPRMSFEIPNSFNYDPQRQLPKTNTIKRCIAGESGSAAKIYTGTPYNIPFELNIYSKNHDEASQIVEQILPYFAPQYNVTVEPIDEIDDFKEDIPISITGVSFTDDYEGTVEQRRLIVYTLTFDMKVNFYGPQPDAGSKIIKRVDIEYFDYDLSQQFGIGDGDSDGYIQTYRVEVDPFTASIDSDYTINETIYDKYVDSV